MVKIAISDFSGLFFSLGVHVRHHDTKVLRFANRLHRILQPEKGIIKGFEPVPRSAITFPNAVRLMPSPRTEKFRFENPSTRKLIANDAITGSLICRDPDADAGVPPSRGK